MVEAQRKRRCGAPPQRVAGALLNHPTAALSRLSGQRGDQRSLGQVLPITARHLLLHHGQFQPSRVEDALVVGQPEPLVGIGRRCVFAPGTRAEGELTTVPTGAALGGENRPRHLREAACEERRGRLNDVVFGLEPGDVRDRGFIRAVVLQRPETHERRHLVHVTPHRPGEQFNLHPVGVEGVTVQAGLVRQAPQPLVQQRVPLGVAVQRSALAQRHHLGGQSQGRVLARRLGWGVGEGRRFRREQIDFGRARDLPAHTLRLDLVSDQPAHRCTEAGDIALAAQLNRVHIGVSHRPPVQ